MKLYRIKMEQMAGNGFLWAKEEYDVVAPTAKVALTRAMAKANTKGFLKTYPIAVKSLEEISDRII